MPWNLLIFPLIAGYYLLTKSNRFKFKQQRLDKQRLIFDSVLLGIVLLLISFILKHLLELRFKESITFIYSNLPFKIPYIGVTFATIIIAIIITEIGNKTIYRDRNKAIKKAIKIVGNELELLLKDSFTNSKLLEFTLDTGKFYIAWVKELPIPSVTNYIRVIPAFSGYRDEKRKLTFTTEYLSVYNEYIKEGKAEDIKELNVDLIITLDNIVNVSYFDIDMYERFNKNPEEKEEGQEGKTDDNNS